MNVSLSCVAKHGQTKMLFCNKAKEILFRISLISKSLISKIMQKKLFYAFLKGKVY